MEAVITNDQLDTDKKYLRMAFIESESSVAIRLKVGCIIVKGNRIVSNGFNHQPSYLSKVCEVVKDSRRVPLFDDSKEIKYLKGLPPSMLETKDTVIHAERSALKKLESNESAEGATLYVTHQPCMGCARLIVKAKIKEVVYSIPYRCSEGLHYLKHNKVKVRQIQVCEF